MKRLVIAMFVLLLVGVLNAQTFKQVTNWDPDKWFNDVYFTDSLNGWVVGNSDYSIMNTTDGGLTWNQQVEPDGILYSEYHGVQFLNKNLGYIIGGPDLYVDPDYAVILKTTNGKDWFRTSKVTGGAIDLFFLDSLSGWVCGGTKDLYYNSDTTGVNGGIVWKTTDGGQTWTTQKIGKSIFTRVVMKENGIGWLKSNRELYYTVDFGTTWQNLNFNRPTPNTILRHIHFFDDQTGYLFANEFFPNREYYIYKTVNGGQTWQLVNTLEKYSFPGFRTVAVIDSLNILAYVFSSRENQSNGYIIRTTDGGLTWKEIFQSPKKPGPYSEVIPIYGLKVNGTQAWAVGWQIWKSDDMVVGIKDMGGNLPTDFQLSQNYPNPFNPSTKIRYSIPKSGNVTLTIYNILGQQVATLVNEYQSVGNYEYSFTAENLASGTYIYRLIAGNYVSTKKMVYVK